MLLRQKKEVRGVKKHIKSTKLTLAIAMAVAAMLLLYACATPVGIMDTDGRAHSDAQRIYRDASLVVRGVCERNHVNAYGVSCYDFRVDEVIAGAAEVGSFIHITDGAMKDEEEYLLYLVEGEDAFYTEDTNTYTLLTDAPLKITNGKVTLFGVKLSLSDIKRDIAAVKSVITMPYNSYYYKELAALVNAADDIFIGEVLYTPALASRRFRADADGTSVENEMPASIVRVKALGVAAGAFNYGDVVELVYAPSMSSDIIDAATLRPVSYGEMQAPALEQGKIYMFFLVKGPDAKQNYHFAVNPMQGYVEIEGNDVFCSYVNSALVRYRNLNDLIIDIRAAL